MAKFDKGILGGFSGTVGTVIGGKWKGMDIMRSRPSKRKGNPSLKQLAQQSKFRMVMKFLHTISELIGESFGDFESGKSAFNAAFSYNLKTAIAGSYPNFSIDYAKVLVSKGGLLNATNPTATATANSHIDFAWGNNSGLANAKATDKVIVAIYCSDLDYSIYSIGTAQRHDATVTIDAASFKGHAVQTWFALISQQGGEASSSIHTGQVMVT